MAPDLHKLVITDRLNGGGANLQDLNHIFIFDLRLGQFTPPTGLTMPVGLDSDELDYDPLNHRAYVANTKAPYFLTVVDLVNNAIVDQIPLFSNPEQPRFNPVDGFVYITIPDDDNANAGAAVLKIDPTKSGAAAVVATFKTPGCPGHGIDIDPVTNTALLGCGNPDTPQALFDLTKGTILTTFPGVNGTDTEYFNSNVRRWYTASSNNTNSGVQCPQDTTDAFPVVGVFAAATKKNQIATIVGAECSGRNGHGLGINPFDNNIYVGARQFPADHGDPNTGQPGVLVFHDPADLAQTLEAAEEAQANVNPLPGFRSKAKVRSESTHISANVNELPLGTNEALLNITTTIGNEVVNCALGGPDEATCKGTLHGDPLLGGEVILAADGTPVAKGRIRQGHDR